MLFDFFLLFFDQLLLSLILFHQLGNLDLTLFRRHHGIIYRNQAAILALLFPFFLNIFVFALFLRFALRRRYMIMSDTRLAEKCAQESIINSW